MTCTCWPTLSCWAPRQCLPPPSATRCAAFPAVLAPANVSHCTVRCRAAMPCHAMCAWHAVCCTGAGAACVLCSGAPVPPPACPVLSASGSCPPPARPPTALSPFLLPPLPLLQTNLMVLGAGGYRNLDFVKFGGPMQLFMLVATSAILVRPPGCRVTQRQGGLPCRLQPRLQPPRACRRGQAAACQSTRLLVGGHQIVPVPCGAATCWPVAQSR